MRDRPSFLFTILLLLGLLLAACGGDTASSTTAEETSTTSAETSTTGDETPTTTTETEPTDEDVLAPLDPAVDVHFALQWLPSSLHVGGFVAKDLGYWEDLGLNVEISRGQGSSDTVRRVAAGDALIGLADATALIPAKVNNPTLPVKAFSLLLQRAPYNVVYVPGRGIESPADLAGASYGGVPGAADTLMYEPFLTTVGVDVGSAEFVALDPGSKVSGLLQGQVDVIPAFISNYSPVVEAAELAGVEVDYWLMAEYGLDPYSIALIAHNSTLEEQPEVVERFLKGWLDGWSYASANPEDAAQSFKKLNPEASESAVLNDLRTTLPLVAPPATAETGMGYMTPEGWERTAALLEKWMEDLGQVSDVADLWTLDHFIKVVPMQTWE